MVSTTASPLRNGPSRTSIPRPGASGAVTQAAAGWTFILDGMEVHFRPETESRLHELAMKTGRPTDDLVEDAMAGYLEELAAVRGMLNSRYDVKSGRVNPIDGEEAFARLRRKSEEPSASR